MIISKTSINPYSILQLKIDPTIWLVLALSIFAWGPLLTPAYFFDAHDAKHSVFFLVEFDQTFRDGYLWPRWSPDFSFGYGYPLFNLYAPLAFYGAEIVHLLGFSIIAAVKAMYILATIGAGLGMYGFVRRLFGSGAGLVAAVVYMYAPFHLVEIFIRSAYAEFVSLAIIPWLFWAFSELIAAPTQRRVVLAGLTYGTLALTHHTTFFTFTPFLIIYILYLIAAKAYKNLQSFGISTLLDMHFAQDKPSISNLQLLISPTLSAAAAGLLGITLAAIYLIPLITELRFIKTEQWTSGSYNYLQHFVYFSQFFSPIWGYGYAGVGLLDDFSYQIGIVIICLIAFALVSSLMRPYPHRQTAFFFLISTIVAILLMSPIATFLWQILPIASLVQFPWRLLALTAFTLSIVAGSLIASLAHQPPNSSIANLPIQNPSPSLYLLALIIILASFSYTLPQYTEIPDWAETPLAVINWDRASIIDRVGMVAVTNQQPQTSPMEQQYLNRQPLSPAGIIAGQGTLEVLHHGGASDKIRITANKPVTVQFYTYDYPGWQVSLNDQSLPHRYEPPFGLITVDVPAGEHTLLLQMGNTPPRLSGSIISGMALVVIVILLFFHLRPTHQN